MPPEKIVVDGIEYSMAKNGDSTILERFDEESGMTVRNIFLSRPDSETRMRRFREQIRISS